MFQIHLLIWSSIHHCWVKDKYLWNKIETTPALSRSEELPGSDAISRKAVPLRTSCASPDDWSVITTVTPVSEHKLLPVHFTWLRRHMSWFLLKIFLKIFDNPCPINNAPISAYLIAWSTTFSSFEQIWTCRSHFWIKRKLFHKTTISACTACSKMTVKFQLQSYSHTISFTNGSNNNINSLC